jgi:hypothetical protein
MKGDESVDDTRIHAKEAAEDVFFGQVVIIWARWFMIVAGAVLALWTTHKSAQLAVAVVPIAALMLMNFYLHGRYLTERPSNSVQIAAASLLDLAVITALVLFWHDGRDVGSGLASPFVAFYYPMLLAFAFVLPRRLAIGYTALAVALCSAASLPQVHSALDAKELLLRIVTMAAMGGLGTFYWRIQRDRRRAAPAI